MKFSSIIRCHHKIFYIWRKSTKFTRFCYWSYHFSNICFSEIVVTPSKMVTDVSFYANVLKRFNGKYFRGYRGFGFHLSNYSLSEFWKYLKQKDWFPPNIQSYPDKWKSILANVSEWDEFSHVLILED